MRENTNRTHRHALRGMAALVLVGAALLVPGEATGASIGARQSDRKLEGRYEQQPAAVGAPLCSPPASCVVPFSLFGVTTGDVAGTMVQAGAGSRMADGSLYANSTVVFTGTVTGCGSGTVTMRSTGVNRGGATTGSIEIVYGSGTGGLASLEGTGTVVSGVSRPMSRIGSGIRS